MKVGLIATRSDPGRSAERPLACANPLLQVGVVEQAAKDDRASRRTICPGRPRPARRRRAGGAGAVGRRLRGRKSSPTAPIRRATSVGRQTRHEPVVIIERLGQDGEDLGVAVLVVADAPQVVDERREAARAAQRSQFQHAVVAESCGQLGIDVEQAEVAKRAVAQVLADVARDLSGERSDRDDQRRPATGPRGPAASGRAAAPSWTSRRSPRRPGGSTPGP